MLGKGLESLIPKKGGSAHTGNQDGSFSHMHTTSSNASLHVLHHTDEDNTSLQKEESIPHMSGPIFHVEIEKIIFLPHSLQ